MMNLKRTKRQIEAVNKWIQNKSHGTLEFATGVGKTNTAMIAIKKLRKINDEIVIDIVVPTRYLKTQWEKELETNKLKNINVYVINTYIKTNHTCGLLIIDEIHNCGSEKRLHIFNQSYMFLLGLTATMHRKDLMHKIINTYAPIVDKIDLQEARDEGYVSDYIVYNLGIELNEYDRATLNEYNKTFYKHFAYFGHNFKLAMSCMSDKSARERYAKTFNLKEDQVGFHAVRFNYFMQKRKNFLYNLDTKKTIADCIINKFEDKKKITFSENISFAESLHGLEYHSKLKRKAREQNLRLFRENQVNTLNTSKALDEGFDVGDIELVIITSSRAVNRVDIQRTGRALRFKPNKLAVIVNLYVKNSKDEDWLRTRQEKSNNIYWIEDVEDIKFERPERLKVKVGKSNSRGYDNDTLND